VILMKERNLKGVSIDSIITQNLQLQSLGTVYTSLKQLYHSKEKRDFCIIFNQTKFYVHKYLVLPFLEHISTNPLNNEVVLEIRCDNNMAFELLIQYCYFQDIDTSSVEFTTEIIESALQIACIFFHSQTHFERILARHFAKSLSIKIIEESSIVRIISSTTFPVIFKQALSLWIAQNTKNLGHNWLKTVPHKIQAELFQHFLIISESHPVLFSDQPLADLFK